MMLMIIPKCTKCKTSENVKFASAWTEDKTRFLIAYCTKCFTVMECSFSAKLIKDADYDDV